MLVDIDVASQQTFDLELAQLLIEKQFVLSRILADPVVKGVRSIPSHASPRWLWRCNTRGSRCGEMTKFTLSSRDYGKKLELCAPYGRRS